VTAIIATGSLAAIALPFMFFATFNGLKMFDHCAKASWSPVGNGYRGHGNGFLTKQQRSLRLDKAIADAERKGKLTEEQTRYCHLEPPHRDLREALY